MQKTHLSYIAETCSTAQLLADNMRSPMMQNTHLSYIVETCSTMQRLVNKEGVTMMQNTHHSDPLLIYTALTALSHTLVV